MNTNLFTQSEGRLIQCHVDPSDPETFVVGRMLWTFEDSFILNSVSPSGRWDGLALFLLDDLVAVEKGTDYLHRLEKLLSLRHETPPETPPKMMDGLHTIMHYAQTHQKPVALELFQSGGRDVVGYLTDMDGEWLRIAQADEMGRPDGTTLVRTRAVSRAFCGDHSLECIELLSNNSEL